MNNLLFATLTATIAAKHADATSNRICDLTRANPTDSVLWQERVTTDARTEAIWKLWLACNLALIDGLLRARTAEAAFIRACRLADRSTSRAPQRVAFHAERRSRTWAAMVDLAREFGY